MENEELQQRIDSLQAELETMKIGQPQAIQYVPQGVNWKLISENSVDPGHKHSAAAINSDTATDGQVLTSDSDGNTAWESPAPGFSDDFTAGEGIDTGDPVSLVAEPALDTSQTVATSNYSFGDTAGQEFLGQGFQINATSEYPTKVGVNIKKVGAPTDTISWYIYSGVSAPTNLIDSGTLTTGSSLTTSLAWVEALTNYQKKITTGVQYYLFFGRSGANDGTNYYQIGGSDNAALTDVYANGDAWRGATITGAAQFGSSNYPNLAFRIYTESASASVLRITKAISQHLADTFIGIAPAVIADGAVGSVTIAGDVTGLSALQPGRVYFADDTGAYSLSAGTFERPILNSETATTGKVIEKPRTPTSFTKRIGGITAEASTTATGETTLATVAVPGGTVGTTGVLRITAYWEAADNANTKTVKIKFGGSVVAETTPSAGENNGIIMVVTIQNRNSESAQFYFSQIRIRGAVSEDETNGTLTLDTTQSQNVIVTSTNPGGDTVLLKFLLIEVIHN